MRPALVALGVLVITIGTAFSQILNDHVDLEFEEDWSGDYYEGHLARNVITHPWLATRLLHNPYWWCNRFFGARGVHPPHFNNVYNPHYGLSWPFGAFFAGHRFPVISPPYSPLIGLGVRRRKYY